MNLEINNKLFVVTGASNGFGRATAEALMHEGAKVIAVSRGMAAARKLQDEYPQQVELLLGDISKSDTISKLVELIGKRKISGLLVNAGGPPVMTFQESKLADWDTAYSSLLRWKVELTQSLLPNFEAQAYGRIVYIESSAVKQPMPNLVLSSSIRLAVVGFVKCLSQDLLPTGITCNILAPGYHRTAAVERLFVKKAESTGKSLENCMDEFEKQMQIKHMGDADNLGSLAAWLLSPKSGYISGQTISVDGGVILSTMG